MMPRIYNKVKITILTVIRSFRSELRLQLLWFPSFPFTNLLSAHVKKGGRGNVVNW